MNKTRRIILKCLYGANKTKASILRPLNYIQGHTKIDIKIIESETDYLSQKRYIEKKLITTPTISAYSCKITAQGIDIVESHNFLIFLRIIKKFWWVIAVLIPMIIYYADLFGLKTKFFTKRF